MCTQNIHHIHPYRSRRRACGMSHSQVLTGCNDNLTLAQSGTDGGSTLAHWQRLCSLVRLSFRGYIHTGHLWVSNVHLLWANEYSTNDHHSWLLIPIQWIRHSDTRLCNWVRLIVIHSPPTPEPVRFLFYSSVKLGHNNRILSNYDTGVESVRRHTVTADPGQREICNYYSRAET